MTSETDGVELDPGFFQFDDIIEKLPDVYHRFALSTVGAIEELHRHFDLSGATVADIGAGTGRSSSGLASRAKRVIAIEPQPGVMNYAVELLAGTDVRNVTYLRGEARALPLRDNSVDHTLTAWAIIDHAEAARITRKGGYVFQIGAGPANMCGELTPLLAQTLGMKRPPAPAPEDFWFGDPDGPMDGSVGGVDFRDLYFDAEYGTVDEACALWGRVYGPVAESYLREREQSSVRFRLRIWYYEVE